MVNCARVKGINVSIEQIQELIALIPVLEKNGLKTEAIVKIVDDFEESPIISEVEEE